MNKKITFLLLFFLLSVGFLVKVPKTEASSFTNAYVRLSQQTANALLSGTICAQPSNASAGTENKIVINFPSDFSISNSTNNWSSNVSGIPSGANPWPGISIHPTAISGQTVTFSSTDLTTDMLYCFNFSSSQSTTGDPGSDKIGTLTTKNSSNATIDSTTYALAILDSNRIGISATVPPDDSYLPVSIESTTPGSNFPQNTTLNYKINYGLLRSEEHTSELQ